jgi:hypothetical protein
LTQATKLKPTAAEMSETALIPIPRQFPEKCEKLAKTAKIREKIMKRVKIALFCPLDFSQSDSYRNIGISKLLEVPTSDGLTVHSEYILRSSQHIHGWR